MFGYYFWLAARSLKRNPVLTLLMISAIALGIGGTAVAIAGAIVLITSDSSDERGTPASPPTAPTGDTPG